MKTLLEIYAAAKSPSDAYPASVVRKALSRFATFIGHPPTVDDAPDNVIAEFRGYLRGGGLAKSSAINTACAVRNVVKLALPDTRDRRARAMDVPAELRMPTAAPPRIPPSEIKPPANPETLLETAYWQIYYPRYACGTDLKTQKLYRLGIDKLSEFLERKAALFDLNDETVMAWLQAGLQRGLAAPTVNQRRSHLLSFWRYLARKRFVDEFPDIKALSEPAPLPLAWTGDQFSALLDACDHWTGPDFAGVNGAAWWRAWILVLYDTGERLGAMLALQWEWLSGPDLIVPAMVRKGRQKPMIYRLQPDTMAAIDAIRAPERDAIFPLKCCQGTYYNRYCRLLKSAGLPHGMRDKTHKVRRTFASHLEAVSPGAATAALGHSSRKVTESYLDPRICMQSRPSDLLPRQWVKKGGAA